MKQCACCKEYKGVDGFQKNSQRKDGLQIWCKECKREYQSGVGKESHIEANLRYRDTAKGKRLNVLVAQRQNKKYPDRAKARWDVNHAVRDGKLFRQPCEICGEVKVEAHHKDYGSPLEVIWLCVKCHVKIHKDKEILCPL